MRTTLELLELLHSNRFNIYDFTDDECESILGLTYKISSTSGTSYFMPIKVTEQASLSLYNRVYNVLALSFVDEPDRPWINLTIYSIDDSMFRGVLKGKHNIDYMWPTVYKFFKHCNRINQSVFIEFCEKELFGIKKFEWN